MEILSRKRFILFLLGSILIFFCLIGLGGYFFAKYQITTPLSQQSDEQVFVINKGEGLEKIASHLQEAGLIRSKFWFTTYIFYKGWTSQLQAGEYSLNPHLDIIQLAEKMTGGEINPQEIKITIPEGFTLKQIDARLAKAGLIKQGELIKESSLEGYLFPDTYQFNKEAGLDEIIEKMRDNFDKKIDNQLMTEIKKQGKTLEEVIIMASLLEKEVASYEDRRLVAGIFWQRLTDKYPLQSCATIAYILSVDKWRYSAEETKINSPYNTYQHLGLPPGPISNPGLETIKAAIYPQASDYYFFLSKPDGQTVFSKTLEEHNQNIAKYLQ